MNETLEEAAERIVREWYGSGEDQCEDCFIKGAKWQQQQLYTEQEVLQLLDTLWDRLDRWYNEDADNEFNLRKWFDECELKKK
jgi:hypothetical protein